MDTATIHYFEEHSGAHRPGKRARSAAKRLHQHPASEAGRFCNVLVLDSLNTPLDDQRRVHAQVVKYLKKPQPAAELRSYPGTQLRLIQSFTDDLRCWPAALNQGKRVQGAGLTPAAVSAETASIQETAAAMMEYALKQRAPCGSLRRARVDPDRRAHKADSCRVAAAAGYLAAFLPQDVPGSGGLSVAILPDPGAAQPFGAQSTISRVRKIECFASSAQVAFIPSCRGVTVDSLYSAAQTLADDAFGTLQAPGRGANSKRQHTAMDEIAKQTGGAPSTVE